MKQYDVVVLGSGPAGQKAAIQAAKLRKRVAVVERGSLGGVCMNTGTIPSKTLREAVLYFSGYRQRSFYGRGYRVKEEVTIQDLLMRARHVTEREHGVIRDQMARNHVHLVSGEGSFQDPHTIRIVTPSGPRTVAADIIVIATGTVPARPASVAFDGHRIIDSDGLLDLEELPRSMIVVGGGVIGTEYATIFAAAGVDVTLIERRSGLLDFVDVEMVDALKYHARLQGVTLRLGEEVASVAGLDDTTRLVTAHLRSGKRVSADTLLFSAGRHGATEQLNLQAVGIATDERGRIAVTEHFQTAVPHIYAVGDVIGFPSLASTSMEQGRLAVSYALSLPTRTSLHPFPLGIYTVPEISMVGQTEEELTRDAVPYEVGRARYREIARGAILGDDVGMLKMLFHADNHRLLGVHVIGEGATELIHIGQAVLAFDGTLEYFVDSVFNYPTLAECYKVAALDAKNKLTAQ
ncbi:MAG: Si-specific NAD(P)(+) transhydrogenase [Candidatus Binatia bacterium]